MTTTGQNFSTFQGDTENVVVLLDLTDTPDVNIELCDFHWVAYKGTTKEIVLDKTTASGIVANNATSEITITINRDETQNLLGHYLHICKMVDPDNFEYTPFAGTLDIYESVI